MKIATVLDRFGRREIGRPAPGGPLRAVDERLVCLTAPQSFEAERYRMLAQSLERRDLKLVGITSPMVGDGKTTTAVNLAAALAEGGDGGVLLVDGDLRRPSVGAALGFEDDAGPGLSEALADGHLQLEDVIRSGPARHLWVMPAGGPPAVPYELIQGPRLPFLMARAAERFRWVVVDTPPLLLVPDARKIVGALDGCLVVVSAHRTPRRLLGEALDQLEPGQVAGLVLNRDDVSPSLRYRSYYTSYARRAPTSKEADRERR